MDPERSWIQPESSYNGNGSYNSNIGNSASDKNSFLYV